MEMLLKHNQARIYWLYSINKTSDCLANHKDCFNLKREPMQNYFKGLACRMFSIKNKRYPEKRKTWGEESPLNK